MIVANARSLKSRPTAVIGLAFAQIEAALGIRQRAGLITLFIDHHATGGAE